MKGRRALGIGLLLMAALAAFGMVASTAEAAPDRLAVGSASAGTGEKVSVTLVASDLANPLVVWTVDITHDGSLLELVECEGQNGSICGPLFGPETTRITGASSSGLEGVVELATLTYRCGDEGGTSALTLEVDTWGGAEIPENPPREVNVSNGGVSCAPIIIDTFPTPTQTIILPPTGTGPSTSSAWQWAVAILSATGASLLGIWALRRERVP